MQDFSSAVEMIIKEKFMKVGWFIATHCIVASVYKFILNITLGDLYIKTHDSESRGQEEAAYATTE